VLQHAVYRFLPRHQEYPILYKTFRLCYGSSFKVWSLPNSRVILLNVFYVYGSVHRWSILIIFQRDATQSSLFIILQVRSSLTPHIFCAALPSNVAKLGHVGGKSCTKNMTSTGGCSYSFVYSWWWVWLTLETRRVNLQNNK